MTLIRERGATVCVWHESKYRTLETLISMNLDSSQEKFESHSFVSPPACSSFQKGCFFLCTVISYSCTVRCTRL